MRRLFNQSEKIAMWLFADGKCQVCGDHLKANWEADHRLPYSKGGVTKVGNGQAVCRKCNRKKGATI